MDRHVSRACVYIRGVVDLVYAMVCVCVVGDVYLAMRATIQRCACTPRALIYAHTLFTNNHGTVATLQEHRALFYYKKGLALLTRWCKDHNFCSCGDMLLTLCTVIWAFWPNAIPIATEVYYLFFVSGLCWCDAVL